MKTATKKPGRKPTEAQKAAAAQKRAWLCTRTAAYRATVKFNQEIQAAMIFGGLSYSEGAAAMKQHNPRYAGCFTLNSCLMIDYAEETNQTEWHTFAGWKELGKSVKKGSTAFLIWGSPKTMTSTKEAENVATGETETIEGSFSRFPICYLFHAGQVESATERATQRQLAA